MGKSASAPPAPDYTAAAQATAAGNLDAARAATAANRVNQVTPYGSLNYDISGQDPYGNPTWTATQSLAPEQKQLLDIQNQLSIGTGQLGQKGLGYVENMISQPFDTSSLPTTGFNAGQSYQDAYMQRLAPQIQQGREALNVDLANRGIPVGSEAYKRAMMTQGQKENDLLAAATTQGFGTGLAANQQGFNQLAYQRNEPINTLNAVRSGAQVQSPTFVNSAQQANTAGADLLGATQMGYNANLSASNAQNAANNQMTQGLFSLGGAALMSDIRTKENIEPIGIDRNGLTIYKYEYKPEFKDHELAGSGVHYGYMAQEVEQVYPYAVRTLNDGYKVVDYGLL
jgi:putative N-acetylmannosamine-6-phosphate epimerase